MALMKHYTISVIILIIMVGCTGCGGNVDSSQTPSGDEDPLLNNTTTTISWVAPTTNPRSA
jgi:hypothetical protein